MTPRTPEEWASYREAQEFAYQQSIRWAKREQDEADDISEYPHLRRTARFTTTTRED